MRIPRRRFLQLAAAAGGLAALPRAAGAQSYPTRPVRIIVATSAGGSTDIAARVIGQWLTERLGQSFVVENRPGGGNNIGTEAAVRAPADGYTLLMANTVNAINATLYDNLGYSFVTDMAPVAILMRTALLMQVHPSVPAKTAAEFIDYAKANPGKINMGSGGNGATGHVSGELFKMMAGVKMVHVPYRGESLALTDLIAGQVQVVFTTIGSSIQYIRAGQLRALAVTTTTRSDALPEVPPLADAVPGYEASGWNGMCAPRGTPVEIIDKLNREINAGLTDPKIKARFEDLGSPPVTGTPAEFGKIIAEDTEKWAKVIRFSGAKPN
jgi:tripartite-type tricarboxylate transporter receptor subunit TctC